MKFLIYIIFFSSLLILPFPIMAQVIDSDGDNISDYDEIEIYRTDPNNADMDGDGFNDKEELVNGYSPHNPLPLKLEETDYDNDGLSDRMELNFHTNLALADTDGDGFLDGDEIKAGYDPNDPDPIRLVKKIEVDTGAQELSRFLGGVRLDKFQISSGVAGSTPTGHYTVYNKDPKAWSRYGLWMPWWNGLAGNGTYGRIGIHELPVWPNGYREGEDHLGTAVSHGCVRLGVGAAELIYDWAPVGTEVFIY